MSEKLRMELAACQSTILSEIAMPQMKRRDIAQTYRLCLESSESDTIDWGVVNAAIIARWSKSGLLWIKNQAWSGKAFS